MKRRALGICALLLLGSCTVKVEAAPGSATSTPVPATTATAATTTTPAGSGQAAPRVVDSGPGVYIASLTGSQVNRGNTWDAEATVQVVDGDGEPMEAVTVEGIWDEGDDEELSCVTDEDGECAFETAGIRKNISSATFEVEAVSHGSLPYLFELDDGWDAEEQATFLSIRKP